MTQNAILGVGIVWNVTGVYMLLNMVSCVHCLHCMHTGFSLHSEVNV